MNIYRDYAKDYNDKIKSYNRKKTLSGLLTALFFLGLAISLLIYNLIILLNTI